MERLTKFNNGIWGMSTQAINNGYDRYSAFSKLAEYENTEFTPEQVKHQHHNLAVSYKCIDDLQAECKLLHNQLMETEKDSQEIILISRNQCDTLSMIQWNLVKKVDALQHQNKKIQQERDDAIKKHDNIVHKLRCVIENKGWLE